MGNSTSDTSGFGLPEIVAAALAAGLTALAAPSPAGSAEIGLDHDEDWNILWSGAVPPPPLPIPIAIDANWTPLTPLLSAPLAASSDARWQAEFPATAAARPRTGDHETLTVSVPLRTAPSSSGTAAAQPRVTLRSDQWSIVDMEGFVRLSAYARGPLEYDDLAMVRRPQALPRRMGTGLGVVTESPVYIGATVTSDAPIYDFDLERFRGARWSTSVFLGADTGIGPLYLGTTKEPDGSRSAYLYLGKWF